jgi:adenylylsulfate kinase
MASQPTNHDDLKPEVPRPQEREQTIAVDFDGVVAEYDGWKGATVLGSPRKDVLRVLHTLRSEGWKIIIHTTRSASEISAYLVLHNIPHDEINQNSSYQNAGPKPVATVYWDDRALRYSGDALEDLKQIRSYKTWSGRV